MLPIDLHSHSRVSDGILTPAELVRRAHQNGAQMLALTDHDEVGGIAEAKAEAARLGMTLVSGVEISVTWAGKTIHIVGLHVNENDPVLVDRLFHNRDGRKARADRMGERFQELGILGAYEGALAYVTNPSLISRKHFARYLVEAGVCPSVKKAFDRYLKEGGPAYIAHQWATLEQAVTWILDAGGMPIVAHPGRYGLSDLAMHEFLTEFKRYGGVGIEVVTGSHTREQYPIFAGVANRYGFLASLGSDFHAPEESTVDVGCLPDFPGKVNPVFEAEAFKDRL
jgi:predicted metal-dependent phosphoesterase TrpH